MKKVFKRTISLCVALATLLVVPTMAVDAQAQETDEVNYVYLDSADQIPWGNIPANTAYIVPNEETVETYDCAEERTIQPRTHMYPWSGHNVANSSYTINEQDSSTTGEYTYSSKYFYGKTTYSIVIKNGLATGTWVDIQSHADSDVEYLKSYSIPAKSTLYCFIENNAHFTTQSKWIFWTTTPVSFTGTIY